MFFFLDPPLLENVRCRGYMTQKHSFLCNTVPLKPTPYESSAGIVTCLFCLNCLCEISLKGLNTLLAHYRLVRYVFTVVVRKKSSIHRQYIHKSTIISIYNQVSIFIIIARYSYTKWIIFKV